MRPTKALTGPGPEHPGGRITKLVSRASAIKVDKTGSKKYLFNTLDSFRNKLG
jgi:hypothetical protein